ncbi:TPA: bifunctional phosphopantothenoylcysteine decarboxylase/phosphopantothenate--cysteine ligase CoaBC [Candidatus Woesearchaeota archaeon]|nr:bifunctional phosphopantothenoylcysteine decarboxylase/phosphopantothenate--cysteine ligase CoaBC [Candidatus Woesearchaeota archaeon]
MPKTILIGISAGIACYKMIEVVERLKEKHAVEIIITEHVQHLLPLAELENTLVPVHRSQWTKGYSWKEYRDEAKSDHITLADAVELFVVAPATANVIAKLAHGIADDLLTTTALAVQSQIMVFPSMNCHMWENPCVQENVATLRKRGIMVVEPAEGNLACGYAGKGRLPEPDEIVAEIEEQLSLSGILLGKKVVVSAGAIAEPLDGVRSITNHSSGKFGIALAEAASRMGAEVALLLGRAEVQPRGKVRVVPTPTSRSLEEAMKRECADACLVVCAAAVPDFRVKERVAGKIHSSKELSLSLVPAPKLISLVKAANPQAYLVGFKALSGAGEKELIAAAKQVIDSAHADLVIANDIAGHPFGSERSMVIMVHADGEIAMHEGTKQELSRIILQGAIERL